METSQGSYRRLSRASYTPASSTVIKTRAPSSKKEQRIKNFKDSKLLLTAASPRIANRCFSLLYRAGLFLTANEARTIGHLGVGFLQLYAKLAQKAISAGRLRFAMVPKVHYLMHCFLGLYK